MAIGVGGRALGMGGAYTALASDVTAGYWNPAGLSHIIYPQVTLMHNELFGSLANYDYGAVALPVGVSTSLAFSVIRLGIDGIPDTRNALIDVNGNGIFDGNDRLDYNKITSFNAASWAFYFSYAKKQSDDFSYGGNVKIIYEDLGAGTATGIGFDVSAQYHVTEKFVLGANFQDVTTTFLAWSTGTKEFITPTLKLGTAYFIDAFDGRFAPAVDVDLRFEGRSSAANAHVGPVSFDFHSGLEFDYKHLVALRTGYSDIGEMNFGAGIHLPKFDIDYSFARDTDIDNTHRISLTFIFQAEQFARSTE